jgi:hypothetical protein
MITREKFDFIKDKYGLYASWAVWANEDIGKPKSNTGDLTVLDPEINDMLLNQLNPDVVLVALNIFRGAITIPLANFHDNRPEDTGFKIRFALRDSPYCGGYMTDIIKYFEEKASGKMMSYLRANKAFEQENMEFFRQELKDIGTENPTIIAFGNNVFSILQRNFGDEFKIIKIPHYAAYINKEKYREQVKIIW